MSDRPVHLASGAARRFALALGVALVCIAIVGGAGASASTEGVDCGQTITKNTRLQLDLVNCPSNGIVIGADNITLDLNGHTVDGDAVPAGDEEADVGIDNSAGHDGVTVKNGAIREFDVGASLPEVSRNRLRGLRVSRNTFLGMDLDLSDHSVIEDSSFSDNGADFEGPGIFVIESHHNRIEDNRVARNGGTGLVQLGSRDNRIAENAFLANGDGGLFLGPSETGQSEDNWVTRNLAARNVFAGIAIEANRTEVGRNHIFHNEEGIIVVGNVNTVTRNHVADVGGCPDCGVGISFEGGTQNLIERNLVSETALAGIRMAAFEPETPAAVDNTVRWNLVRHAGTDGILVESTATDTLLERNFAIGAGDDGIDVAAAGTTLSRNTANQNQDLGIEAVTGVTDAGGNRAHGNGNPLQCQNVFCR